MGPSHKKSSHDPIILSPDQVVAVRTALSKGELVRDDIVLSIISETMARSKKMNFVIDGFPRTLKQVEGFRDQVRNQCWQTNSAGWL